MGGFVADRLEGGDGVFESVGDEGQQSTVATAIVVEGTKGHINRPLGEEVFLGAHVGFVAEVVVEGIIHPLHAVRESFECSIVAHQLSEETA